MKRRVLLLLLLLVAGAIVNVAVAWGCAMSNDLCLDPPAEALRSSVDGYDTVTLVRAQAFGSESFGVLWQGNPKLRIPGQPVPGTIYGAVAAFGMWAMWANRYASHSDDAWSSSTIPHWVDLQPWRDSLPANDTLASMSERFGRMRYAHFEARGWPLRSNYSIVEPVNDWQKYVPASLWNGVQAFPRGEVSHIATLPMPSDCILPLRPLWPGFAINTVFYAVILWLLFAAPFVLRRRRRIRRGLCPKCAYDLRNRASDSSVCPECGATAG